MDSSTSTDPHKDATTAAAMAATPPAVTTTIIVRGTTTAALTAGLGWYLKYECHLHLSWTGNQWNETLQGMTRWPLPVAPQKVRRKRQGKYSYYQNVCTVSYSMVWWDVHRWHRELDWMALSGINMPLAFQGQERVWQITLLELGLTDEQVRTWLGGPAFMAWQRMGNIQAWGGPMPQSWIDNQYQLQKQLLHRMRTLGMKPTLPAFAGFVPPETANLFPRANITLSNSWGNFNSSYTPVHLVEATDPLFQTIGTLFLRKQRQLYAEYFRASAKSIHYYNADTYNEMDPTSTDLTYLRRAANAVFTSIRSVDPTGVWVLQGWLFVNSNFWTNPRIEAYLSGVDDDDATTATTATTTTTSGRKAQNHAGVGTPGNSNERERIIILDLMSEVHPQYRRSNYYFGKSYIYNMLHNFGGNHGLYGRMHVISTDPVTLFRENQLAKDTVGGVKDDRENKNNIQGIGLTMEGINQNFIVYELMTEMSWRDDNDTITISEDRQYNNLSDPSPFLSQWVHDYVTRRYGLSRKNKTMISSLAIQSVEEAWQQLLKTVYTCKTLQMGVTKSIAVKRPRMANMTHPGFQPTALFYPPEELYRAWKLLLEAGEDSRALSSLETYRYDLVDVTRQVLSDLLLPCHARMVDSFQQHDPVAFQAESHRFLMILDDLERILATHDLFLLETQWLGPARARAREHSKHVSVEDADTLSAIYEFNARNQLTLWGPQGEISDYASKQFASLVSKYYRPRWELFIQYALVAMAAKMDFDNSQFNRKCLIWEQQWQHRREIYQSEAQGNTVEISRKLYEKYVALRSVEQEVPN